jgi:hydrophobic/amphiphilic exporter-1 (mainly G- bacteria), HAE1 family
LTIAGGPARRYTSGQSIDAKEAVAKRVLPADVSYEWTAMSYQEKTTGNKLYYVFALSLLLVYLVLPGSTKAGSCRSPA